MGFSKLEVIYGATTKSKKSKSSI